MIADAEMVSDFCYVDVLVVYFCLSALGVLNRGRHQLLQHSWVFQGPLVPHGWHFLDEPRRLGCLEHVRINKHTHTHLSAFLCNFLVFSYVAGKKQV